MQFRTISSAKCATVWPEWKGKVEQLDTHLNLDSGDYQYVDVECPDKCGQQVQERQLATHVANKWSKRSFTCMHCGFKATYEVVSEKHWPECQNYPVSCPNWCQIGAVERNTLEDHLHWEASEARHGETHWRQHSKTLGTDGICEHEAKPRVWREAIRAARWISRVSGTERQTDWSHSGDSSRRER